MDGSSGMMQVVGVPLAFPVNSSIKFVNHDHAYKNEYAYTISINSSSYTGTYPDN